VVDTKAATSGVWRALRSGASIQATRAAGDSAHPTTRAVFPSAAATLPRGPVRSQFDSAPAGRRRNSLTRFEFRRAVRFCSRLGSVSVRSAAE